MKRHCPTHGYIDIEQAWGCPECLAELRAARARDAELAGTQQTEISELRAVIERALQLLNDGRRYGAIEVLSPYGDAEGEGKVAPHACRCIAPLIGERPSGYARCRLCNGYISAQYIIGLQNEIGRLRSGQPK